jgi:hypothetical protein
VKVKEVLEELQKCEGLSEDSGANTMDLVTAL